MPRAKKPKPIYDDHLIEDIERRWEERLDRSRQVLEAHRRRWVRRFQRQTSGVGWLE